MPLSESLLYKYESQLRRIEEHREKNAEKNIKRIYEAIAKDLREFVSEYYASYAQDDVLSYEILYQKGRYARFLQEVVDRIDKLEPEIFEELTDLIDEAYRACYEGMVKAVEKAKNAEELKINLSGVQSVRPEVIKEATENPITGLTLSDRLEKHRAEIIYNIKQAIGLGLQNGDRFSTMARRISQQCNFSYGKSITVVRTECRRVRERAFNDSAIAIDDVIKRGSSGLIGIKIWRTMKDEIVRPQTRYKTKSGYKRGKTRRNAPNHIKMEGQTVLTNEKFDLGGGVKADAPLQSGVAGHDINCRCYASHAWVTPEEYARLTGKDAPVNDKFFENQFTNNDETGIIELNRQVRRRDENKRAFQNLEIPMQKRYVLRTAQKYGVPTNGLTFKIQRSENLLALPFYGSVDYNNIGRIDLFPNAFINEEQLIRTIIHEICHVKQLNKYGKQYAQDNIALMEKQAERFERFYYSIVKKRVK